MLEAKDSDATLCATDTWAGEWEFQSPDTELESQTGTPYMDAQLFRVV